MLLPLFILFSAISFAREPGGHEPREPHPPSCDWGRVNACIAAHQAAAANNRQSAAQNADKLQALRNDLDQLNLANGDLQAKISGMNAEQELLEAEISSMGQAEEPVPAPLFADFPGLEIFFPQTALQRYWDDRYPAEREQMLSGRLGQLKPEIAEYNLRAQKFARDITGLNSEIQAETAALNSAQAEAGQHDRMSRDGCHSEICHSGN
jgi:hypothetical protein